MPCLVAVVEDAGENNRQTAIPSSAKSHAAVHPAGKWLRRGAGPNPRPNHPPTPENPRPEGVWYTNSKGLAQTVRDKLWE